MRVPLSWLRELVPVEASPEDLAERLSLGGLAVEEVLRTGAGIDGVVVGEVVSVRDHPDADNLVLVVVDTGSGRRDIVCGARNFSAGDRVPVAAPGAKLPGGTEIGRRTVRGQTSDGMLCSARELELSDDHSGILVLAADAPLGADVRTALGLDDVVLHLDVTPNRPDALSIVGVAREVAALYGLPLAVPEPSVPETGPDVSTLAAVRIEDPRGCARYLARVVTGVRVGPSPWWMRRRLFACGMRPISNVVDVTNYVLLERGHPLHAFDLARLAGRQIVVRRPRRGEVVTTLDGVRRALDRTDVVICDAERPVAVAGVMGGADSEVGDDSTDLLLESAWFDPIRVLRTARRLGLRTEASVRFERGADPEAVPTAAARAAALFAEVCGGTVARGAVDVHPRPAKRRRITLRTARANAFLGTDATAEQMSGWLSALGCSVQAGRGSLRVEPPTFRPDLLAEEDLFEEIARLYGYGRVPATLPPVRQVGGLTRSQSVRRLARRALLGAGLSEATTLSLVTPALADRLGVPPGHSLRSAIRLANPVSEEEAVLRPSLVWGLLLAAQRNAARGASSIALFEIGATFVPREGDAPAEPLEAAWVLAGEMPQGWSSAGRPYDFFDSKGIAEALLRAIGVTNIETSPGIAEPAGMHPGRAATLAAGETPVGHVAELHPRTAAALDLPGRVALGALDLGAAIAAAREFLPRPLPRFPAVLRDLAVIVPEDTPAAEVERRIRSSGGDLLESFRLFDLYRGEPIPPGCKSLAFSLTIRHPERTLTDADADGVLQALHQGVRDAGWSIRA